MCGIVGVFGLGVGVSVSDRALVRMRDTMVHRGPDDAGIWRCPWAVMGHRRLSVIAPGPGGHQPMLSRDGRYAISYNGELYNDAQLREELRRLGVRFRTECDTETVLMALATWGEDGIAKLRGMFALAFVDRDRRRVILSRDPLGVKPLYTARVSGGGGVQVVFASEPPAVLAHPDIAIRPDWGVVSSYMTTIRPTLGSRTMFEGVETLLPGETRVYETATDETPTVIDAWEAGKDSGVSDGEQTGAVVRDSILSHLRADVPMCSMLSGGLDSAVITQVTNGRTDGLRTYCAGAEETGFDDDFAHARNLAGVVGTAHHETIVDRDFFASQWGSLVSKTGVPLSTPNEVAIYAVARALRSEGNVVALSGEGADELFGGYEPPMKQAAAHLASLGGHADTDGGLFQLRSNSWIATEMKSRLLRDSAWEKAGRDNAMIAEYRGTFDRIRAGSPADSGLQAHLRFHRRMNLPNLLRRLDSATMLASVEGRTPFADVRVARFAEGLRMDQKFVDGEPAQTKRALREAFASVLPETIVNRPKASFPLPFQKWAGTQASMLRTGEFARELFHTEAVQTVAAAPEQLWPLAWPMINLALWGERWWGRGAVEPKPAERAVGV